MSHHVGTNYYYSSQPGKSICQLNQTTTDINHNKSLKHMFKLIYYLLQLNIFSYITEVHLKPYKSVLWLIFPKRHAKNMNINSHQKNQSQGFCTTKFMFQYSLPLFLVQTFIYGDSRSDQRHLTKMKGIWKVGKNKSNCSSFSSWKMLGIYIRVNGNRHRGPIKT